jgi:hypothetical protein
MPSYHQHVPAEYQYYSCICAYVCIYIYIVCIIISILRRWHTWSCHSFDYRFHAPRFLDRQLPRRRRPLRRRAVRRPCLALRLRQKVKPVSKNGTQLVYRHSWHKNPNPKELDFRKNWLLIQELFKSPRNRGFKADGGKKCPCNYLDIFLEIHRIVGELFNIKVSGAFLLQRCGGNQQSFECV